MPCPRQYGLATMLCGLIGLSAPAVAQIGPGNVLLVWNSQSSDSTSVRDLYVAAHPGVVELDLNDSTLAPGSINRADYVSKIRTPVRDFINGAGPLPDRTAQIMVIATTRGLPARVLSPVGTDEFQVFSAWSSIESELAILQQDLEAVGTPFLAFRYSGLIDNPYHRTFNQPIDGFSRASVTLARTFDAVRTLTGPGPNDFVESWEVLGLGPGDIYLVCRIDSGPATFGSAEAIANIAALLDRSADLRVCTSQVQALLDESNVPANERELDEGEFPPLFAGSTDFENTAALLSAQGVATRHDKTFAFIDGSLLADPTRLLLVLGTYGENHSAFGWGANPAGAATYLQTYRFHPSSILLNIESWSGTSMHAPGSVRNSQQEQVLDFIALGGSFAVGNVMEPFTFGIADLEMISVNMLQHGLTFAEAAWSAIPALSWQNVPVGDPLARITVGIGAHFDRNADLVIDVEDLYLYHGAPLDHDCNGLLNDSDRQALLDALRRDEASDIQVP